MTDTDPSNYFGEQIDLELTKTVSAGPHNVGDTVTFTIHVLNNGPSNATGVAVQDVVPNGYANIANISNGGTESNGTISWSGLSIANGGSVDLTFQAVIQASGSYTNVAQVTAADQPDSTPPRATACRARMIRTAPWSFPVQSLTSVWSRRFPVARTTMPGMWLLSR